MPVVQHGEEFAVNRGLPVPASIFLHLAFKHDKAGCLWQASD
jgi:hypothetical protein